MLLPFNFFLLSPISWHIMNFKWKCWCKIINCIVLQVIIRSWERRPFPSSAQLHQHEALHPRACCHVHGTFGSNVTHVLLFPNTCFTSGVKELSIPYIIDMKESNLPLMLILLGFLSIIYKSNAWNVSFMISCWTIEIHSELSIFADAVKTFFRMGWECVWGWGLGAREEISSSSCYCCCFNSWGGDKHGSKC
jgi:hypothetical protein